jgi:5-dehydro-2-deoxygluconokinase
MQYDPGKGSQGAGVSIGCERLTMSQEVFVDHKLYDVVCMGRSSIDLYAQDIGVPFEEIQGFAAYVGGCPTNISVGVRRLGLRPALLTAVGEDPVGNFLLRFLEKEGVDTSFIPRKPGRRTSAVLLGIQPPDRFPLVFYRDNCADIELDIDDVLAIPFQQARALLISGTGLSKEPSRSATLLAAERAREAGALVFLDIDFRADQWHDPRAFGVTVRQALPLVDFAIGTEAEIKAVTGMAGFTITHSQVSDPQVQGDLEQAIRFILSRATKCLVLKCGAQGSRVCLPDGRVLPAPGFPVEVLNILGAGDAFASGFMYGILQGWDWQRAARLGNATGAIVVTRPACSNSMPTWQEVEAFVAGYGGL